MKRENIFLEACKDINKRKEELALKEAREIEDYNMKHSTERLANKINGILESREFNQRYLSRLKESYKDKALATALKGIYIEALDPASLTDDGILLAESMVDNYIKENGGATKILNGVKNNTYFLARLTQIVEDAADDEVEKDKKEESEDKDDKSKKEEKKESKEKEDKDDVSFKDDEDSDDAKKEDDSDDIDLASGSDQDDAADDIINGDEDSDDENDKKSKKKETKEKSIDGTPESNGKVFDELEKEEDVRKAVNLIRKRVSDAEETFIKRNAEDKKQINDLLNKISDNIKTVEDIDDKEDSKSKVAEESANIARQKINEITEHRPLSVFEKLTRNLSKNIVRNTVTKEMYMTESGKLDMPAVYESARVMYGFLETLNTLQLEKVDKKYIKETLDSMK